MLNKNTYFTPSTNLREDLSRDDLFNNIIVTKQIIKTLKIFSKKDNISQNSAVSIVGPYGSGKSTTALVLYRYLTNSLPLKINNKLEGLVDQNENSFSKNEVKIIIGQKVSLEKSLLKSFDVKKSITRFIDKNYIQKHKRLVLIIDEFGKFLEFSSEDPSNGDVFVLQELAELAVRSNGFNRRTWR